MIIQKSFTTLVNLYTTITRGKVTNHQESKDVVSNNTLDPQVEIPTETLSKGILDVQTDGTLRLMAINTLGIAEYHIFLNEEQLDHYLSQNEMIDIWEIEDKREKKLTTIYKYYTWDEVNTFTSKEELYKEISSGTEHGVFSIHDIDAKEERYIQRKVSWFQQSFEDVTLEEAQVTLLKGEAGLALRSQCYALGIAALVTVPVITGIGKTSSKSWEELKTTCSMTLPYSFFNSLQKTTTLLSTAMLTYRMSGISTGPGKYSTQTLSAAMLGALAWSGIAEAQLCPQLVGSYATLGSANGITVSGSYAYVAAGTSGGLQIIDVSNIANPTFVGWYDTPSQAYGVALSGDYAYVVDYSSGLQIIDVSNKANPTRVGSYNTPGYAYGGIAVSGNYAYVADWNVGGLQIIDVSNKANPTLAGWYNTPGYANGVAVSGNYAYVADGTGGGLQIIDVSNKANPTLAGWYNTPGGAEEVVLSGTYAYVADRNSGLQIIDVSNVTNPTYVGGYDTPDRAEDIVVSGTYAYVVDGSSGLQIIDVSNVANPIYLGSYSTIGFARGVDVSGTYAYVTDSGSGLQIIDVSCLLSSSTTSSSATSTSTSSSNQPSFSSTTLMSSSQSNSNVSSSFSSESWPINTLVNQSSSILNGTFLGITSHMTTIPLTADSGSNNPRLLGISLGVGIAGLICLGVSGTTFFYLVKKRKYSKRIATSETGSKAHAILELRPVKKIGHNEIGEKYFQLSTIGEDEAEGIYQQTGHLIVVPEGKKKVQYVIGKGHFGAIKVAQRIEDGQYVVSKKVKGDKNIEVSEAEADMQKEAAGENILPIYNTIRLEKALYHFMPLAGLGDGSAIQQQLASLRDSRLAIEIVKFVAKDLLTGLKTLHGKGIYHLDIKPDNFVFTKEGTGYITDFGCAKKSTTPQISSRAIGDNRYFSPERLQGFKNEITFDGEKADLWAAGVTLLEILKNISPFQLFEMPGQFALRVQKCNQDYFQEKLQLFKEFHEPKEGTIWWVIKGVLDPNSASRFTADKALGAPCFKWLNKSLQEKVFEDLKRGTFAQSSKNEKEATSLSNYSGIVQDSMKGDTSPIYDYENYREYYVEKGHDLHEALQDVQSGNNRDYIFSSGNPKDK